MTWQRGAPDEVVCENPHRQGQPHAAPVATHATSVTHETAGQRPAIGLCRPPDPQSLADSRLNQESVENVSDDLSPAVVAMFGGNEVVTDPDRHDDQAAGLHLEPVGAELAEQRTEVVHLPAVDPTQPRSDLRVTPRPVADREVDRYPDSRVLGVGDGEQSTQLGPGGRRARATFHLIDHALGDLALPRGEHFLQQGSPVGEVTVETSLGHAQSLRQNLDPYGVRPAAGQCLESLFDPRTAGGLGVSHRWPPVSTVTISKIYTVAHNRAMFIHTLPHTLRSEMRLTPSTHTDRAWRIHALAPDFAVEDVWSLPTPGGPDELPRLVEAIFGGEFPQGAPRVVGWLWEARWKLGGLLHWDGQSGGVGARVPSLRDRIPVSERAASGDLALDLEPFSLVYLLRDEFAAELANRTVHAVMHLGWVPDGTGGHRGQMAVLVKPNGLLGWVYMHAITPFRRYFVYPALLGYIEKRWQATTPAPTGRSTTAKPANP